MTASDQLFQKGDLLVLKEGFNSSPGFVVLFNEYLVDNSEWFSGRVYQESGGNWYESELYAPFYELKKKGNNKVSSSEEVRITSSTGGAKGQKLARMSLLPVDALWELMEQYGKGVDKYMSQDNLDNWRHGYDWSLSFDAAFRHLLQALGGEDYDEEFSSKHVIAAAWHCLTLAHFMNREDLAHFDNRQAKALEEYLENKEKDD